jgi:hypothetical protein
MPADEGEGLGTDPAGEVLAEGVPVFFFPLPTTAVLGLAGISISAIEKSEDIEDWGCLLASIVVVVVAIVLM